MAVFERTTADVAGERLAVDRQRSVFGDRSILAEWRGRIIDFGDVDRDCGVDWYAFGFRIRHLVDDVDRSTEDVGRCGVHHTIVAWIVRCIRSDNGCRTFARRGLGHNRQEFRSETVVHKVVC